MLGSRIAFFLLIALLGFAQPSFAQNVIDATVDTAVEEPTEFFLKRKVGIARFSNETVSGTTFLVDDSGDRLGKQASDILSARLAETGKFLMFERMDGDNVTAEQMLAGLKEEGVAIDYLIVGSVSEFGRSTQSETGVFQRKKTQRAYAKVNVRLIDVETGRIIFATEGAGEATSEAKKTLGAGTSAGYDQSLTDKSMSPRKKATTLSPEALARDWRLASSSLFMKTAGLLRTHRPAPRFRCLANGSQPLKSLHRLVKTNSTKFPWCPS